MSEAERRGIQLLQDQHPRHRVTLEHGVAVLTPLTAEELRRQQRSAEALGSRVATALELNV